MGFCKLFIATNAKIFGVTPTYLYFEAETAVLWVVGARPPNSLEERMGLRAHTPDTAATAQCEPAVYKRVLESPSCASADSSTDNRCAEDRFRLRGRAQRDY